MLNILTVLFMATIYARTPTLELEVELHCSSKALPVAGEAIVKELGIDKKVQRLQRRYVPKYIQPYIGTAFAIHEIVVNQRIEWRWEF